MAEKIFRKINVLEMHSSLGYAGGQRNMFTYAKNFDRNIFNVFVASYNEGGMYEKKLQEAGIDFVVSKKDVGKIIDFFREKNIDIIHIHRSGGYVPLESQILLEAKKINKNLVVVEKNIFGKYDHVSHGDMDCSLFQSMMHIHERYVPASGMAFDFEKMKVFYNMVDADDFEKYRLAESEISKYKSNLGIASDDFVIGKIARPHLAKWSDLILDMMPYLVSLVPKIKLVLVGVPTSRVKKIKKSNFANHVILLPDTSDQREVHTFYQAIDVLVHSSKIGECNGNTINEAMFWKKPVVVNSTPKKDNGQLEQVNHMTDGIIANYPQNFARAVEYLYKNQDAAAVMGIKGHDKVLQLNDPTLITKRLEKIFIEKIEKRGYFFDLSIHQLYDKILFSPDQKIIADYKQEYKKRLQWDFGGLTTKEKVVNFCKIPVRFYYKLRDFLEDKFGV